MQLVCLTCGREIRMPDRPAALAAFVQGSLSTATLP